MYVKALFEVYKLLGRLGIKNKDIIGMGGDVVKMGKSLFNTRINPQLLKFVEKNQKIPTKILENIKIHARTLKNVTESQKKLFEANLKDLVNAKFPKPPVSSVKQPVTSVKDAAEAFKGWKPTVIKGGKDGLATGGIANHFRKRMSPPTFAERFDLGGLAGRVKFGQGTPQRLSLIDNLKAAIAQAEKTGDYNILKLKSRPSRVALYGDSGGILSDQTAKYLNNVDPSSKFYKGKNYAKSFAKEVGISSSGLNKILSKRTKAIYDYGRAVEAGLTATKKNISRVNPNKIKFLQLLDEGVSDLDTLAKKLKLGRKEVTNIAESLYKDVYATSTAISQGASRTTGTGVATFLPDKTTPLNKVLKQLHNIDGLERIEQRQIKKLLSEIYGGGKHPELYAAFNKKINEYYKIKDSLKGKVRLNLDHPLSVKMIRQLKLGKDALLHVQPITQELNTGVKALFDKTYAAAHKANNKVKMKKIINLAKKIELSMGTTGLTGDSFLKQDLKKTILKNLKKQNVIATNIEKLPKEEITKVFKDQRSVLGNLKKYSAAELKAMAKILAKQTTKRAGAKILYPAMIANELLFGRKFDEFKSFPLTVSRDVEQINELADMAKEKFNYFDGGIVSLKR